MTVRVSRTFTVPLPQADAWDLLSDPAVRAEAISVVERYESHDEGNNEMTWHVSLPIPAVRTTMAVETADIDRDPPDFVEFEGRSRIMHVIGEHELSTVEDGTRIVNRFAVDGSVPGLERFFKRNLDAELDNFEQLLQDYIDDDER